LKGSEAEQVFMLLILPLSQKGESSQRFLSRTQVCLAMNKFKLWVSKFWLWVFGLKFDHIKQVTLKNGKSIKVLIFKGDNAYFDAKVLLISNVIIAGKHLFSDCSKNVRDFILAHEYTHARVPWLVDLVYSIIMLFLGMAAFGFLFETIFFLFLAAKLHNVLILAVYSVISLLIAMFLFGFFSWLYEGYAELGAIRILGVNATKKAYDEMKKKSKKRSWHASFIGRLTHPPNRWILKLYEWFH
jgi:hypothetical protein